MRRLIGALTAVLFLTLAQPARADTVTLLWTGSAGATSYLIEQSTDQGATWVTAGLPTLAACTGAGATPAFACSFTLNAVPATGLVLFRYSAVNAVGRGTRFGAGSWYNATWAPPVVPINVGL